MRELPRRRPGKANPVDPVPDTAEELGGDPEPDLSDVPTEQLVAELEAGGAAYDAHVELRRITGDLPPEPVASPSRQEVVRGPLRYIKNQEAAGITLEEWTAYRDGATTYDVIATIEAAHDALTA